MKYKHTCSSSRCQLIDLSNSAPSVPPHVAHDLSAVASTPAFPLVNGLSDGPPWWLPFEASLLTWRFDRKKSASLLRLEELMIWRTEAEL